MTKYKIIENFLIDEENLNLLHIAMMDQVRNMIPNEFIFKTPKYNYSALLNIENIQPETKGYIVDELLKNSKAKIVTKLDKKLLRPTDVTLQIPNCKKFQKDTGWKLKIPFKMSVKKLLMDCRKMQ